MDLSGFLIDPSSGEPLSDLSLSLSEIPPIPRQPRERPVFRRFASDSSATSFSSTLTQSSSVSPVSSTSRSSASSPTGLNTLPSPKATTPTATSSLSALPRPTRPGGRSTTRTSFVGSASEFLRAAPAQAPVPERLKNSVLITWDQSPFHHRATGSSGRSVHPNHSSYQGNLSGGSRFSGPPISPNSPPSPSTPSSSASCYFSSANSGSQNWMPYGQDTIPLAGAKSNRVEKEQARRKLDCEAYSAWVGPSAGPDERVSSGMGSQAWGDMGLNLDSLDELMSGGPKGRVRSRSR
ncbi:hypothetical protein [Phaffia rhodozyma]|uniref:Uncharacterized protein n=1 Tax=Phaffia rhodozyma TaxID=264483 RepID=A0A0F7SS76_PHARH|nr:hypothetical protein [Phaffia rhodozyma]